MLEESNYHRSVCQEFFVNSLKKGRLMGKQEEINRLQSPTIRNVSVRLYTRSEKTWMKDLYMLVWVSHRAASARSS